MLETVRWQEVRCLPREDKVDVFMKDSDAFTWYMERDPILRSTVVSVVWLDRSPDWEKLVATLDRATRLIPVFRQRVVEPPGRIATPRWTVDGGFDLTWHLRRMDAPSPHTSEAVLEVARHEAMTAFDRSRPLWEFTLIEHLEEETAAMVMKFHHSMTDGIGAVQLAVLLFDVERVPGRSGSMPDAPAGEPMETTELVRVSIARDWRKFSGLVSAQARSLVPSTLRAARHPLESVGAVLATVRSIGRTVAPVQETRSPIMVGRGLGRRLDVIEIELADLKRAASKAGGSINDGFIAGITGGLRRYHEHHGAPVDELRVTLPISIRTPEDPIGGNRITLMRFTVPVSGQDPAQRIHEIGRRCGAARHEPSLGFTDAIAGTLNLLPPGVVGGMLKHVDFVASDVPGFTTPVYLAGALVGRQVAFGPTIGSSVNLTLLSFNDTCSVGITMDAAAIPDHDVFVDCMQGGFEEVLALGGDDRPVRAPFRDRTAGAT
jgi:diacylglycerol O-acyltransferase